MRSMEAVRPVRGPTMAAGSRSRSPLRTAVTRRWLIERITYAAAVSASLEVSAMKIDTKLHDYSARRAGTETGKPKWKNKLRRWTLARGEPGEVE